MKKQFKRDKKLTVAYKFDIRAVSEEGVIEGYASVFDVVDSYKTAIKPGAFAESIASKTAAGIKVLFQHNPNEPIGSCLEIKEDSVGLWVKTQLILTVQRAREVYELIKAGALDSFSIGFMILEDAWDKETGVIDIKKVDLWEYSVVTFPANKLAMVQNVRSEDVIEEEETEEDNVLDDCLTEIRESQFILESLETVRKMKNLLR